MIAFDTEDDNGNMTLANFFNGSIHTTFDHKDFKDLNSFKREVIKFIDFNPSEEFIAHNLEYDLSNIYYQKYLPKIDFYYSGRLIFARCPESEITFLDSFNFSFSNLKSLGHSIGLEKMEVEGEFYNVEYCRRDTEIVYYYMENFRKQLKGEFKAKTKMTLAGTAQNLYLKKFASLKLDGKNIDTKLLNWYFGGRCEAFFIGKVDTPVFEMDVNSMYPYVMKKYKYPTGEGNVSNSIQSELYLLHGTIKVTGEIPVVPVRKERLIFPVGTFEGYFCSPELDYGIKSGFIEIIEIKQVINFDETDFVFSEFVDTFYTKREIAKKEDNKFLSNYYKLIMNSVYGRFCQHKGLKVLTGDKNKIQEYVNEDIGYYEIPSDGGKGKNFALGIFITSFARLELFKMVEQVVCNGFRPLYCDTDSCYFTSGKDQILEDVEKIYEQFSVDTALGNVSLKCYDRAEFYNAKVYYAHAFSEYEKYTVKGVKEANRAEYLEKGQTTYKKPIKLRPALTGIKGFRANQWIDFTIRQKGTYTKRTVLKDGSTKPIELLLYK